MYLILTVQSVNNRIFRLGMSNADQLMILPNLQGQQIFIDFFGWEISEVQLGIFFDNGNLINQTISRWILANNYSHITNIQRPTKLVFELVNNIFKYYPCQAH